MTLTYKLPEKELIPFQPTSTQFHPVVKLPSEYEVYDFTEGYDPNRKLKTQYGIGKYAEQRPGMYTSDHFVSDKRTVHIGIDVATPVDEPVYAFTDGVIFKLGYNHLPLDYGATIITEHRIEKWRIFALHGHLSKKSLMIRNIGDRFKAGDLLAYVGDRHENGGWNPHLHFQLSQVEPYSYDLPGVVAPKDIKWARLAFPDPRLVLGPLY